MVGAVVKAPIFIRVPAIFTIRPDTGYQNYPAGYPAI